MNQQAAIAKALLEGKSLSIMTSFQWFGCTNLPRTLGRGIFRDSGVIISSEQINFTTKYGQPGYYFRYKLFYTPQNKDAIEKLKAYVSNEQQQEFTKAVKKGPKFLEPQEPVKDNASEKQAYKQPELWK